VGPLLALIEAAEGPLKPGASILDFGCGVGNGIAALLARGYDAHGVDIYEYWGEHAELYWTDAPPPPPDIRERLSVAQIDPYKLPYSDNSFDYVISNQVIEHVDNRRSVFEEIRRVLKADGTSVHIFPSRWTPLVEGHVNVPFPMLCKSEAYLKLAAIAGIRGPRQAGFNWQGVYQSNVAQMKITHYPSKREILCDAQSAGLLARFAQDDYIARGGTGWMHLYDRLSRFGLGMLALAAGRTFLQHMLVLTPRRCPARAER